MRRSSNRHPSATDYFQRQEELAIQARIAVNTQKVQSLLDEDSLGISEPSESALPAPAKKGKQAIPQDVQERQRLWDNWQAYRQACAEEKTRATYKPFIAWADSQGLELPSTDAKFLKRQVDAHRKWLKSS